MKNFLKSFKKENGQSMVEFAIILPILLLIICGIIDFGWLFYNSISVNNCSREGARYAIVNTASPDVVNLTKQRVASAAPGYLKNKLTTTVVFSDPSSPRDGDVTVTVVGKIKVLTPILGVFYPNQEINLTSKTVMKVE